MKVIDDAGTYVSPSNFWEKSDENLEQLFCIDFIQNCSDYTTLDTSDCFCMKCNSIRCILRCTAASENCCYCYGCEACWGTDWGLITAMQVSVFLLSVLGIISVIVMYCKVCNRAPETECQGHNVLQIDCNDECVNSVTQNCALQNTRDRPPSYSEACSAPPLYSSPYNRVSMLEAPPVYPETPKLSKRESQSADSVPTIAHHI